MPKLTEVMESGATNAPDSACPRCNKRKATVTIRGALETRRTNQTNGEKGFAKHLRHTSSGLICRVCANEVMDQIDQLLGVKA